MRILLAGGVLFAASAATFAADTGVTGGNQPFSNMQPSLAITEVMPLQGIFPPRDSTGSASGDTLGFMYQFAGNFTPGTSVTASGQTLSIAQNTALFSILGTTYGGNGINTFALPNLNGTAIVGAGSGPGLPTQILGGSTGSSTVNLTIAQMPAHDHTLSSGITGTTGGSQPFNNMQPSLPMQTLIATTGIFPSRGDASGPGTFIGEVANFAGNFAPAGWAVADGSLLSISSNTALFSILGTTYGGNGITTFALPDLRGRVAVGASNTLPLGMTFGSAATTLTAAQLPAHDHTLPGGGVTGTTGGSQPVNNDQPSLALHYLIATAGIFPSRGSSGSGFDPTLPILGQITEFAGNFAPSGWAFAEGQLLPIIGNEALFSVIGTMYGGDGIHDFALPDFRDRTAIGADGTDFIVGETLGSDSVALTAANLPAHDHTLPDTTGVPEPATLALLGVALAGLGATRRRRG